MSYQPAPQAAPVQRIRHDNSMNIDSGTKEMLFTLGAIGVGAVGAFFLADYITKGNILGGILPSPSPGTEPADTQEEGTTGGTASNLALIETQEPFDRYTKVNSFVANAYRGNPAPARLPAFEIDDDEVDSDEVIEGEDDLALNQVFTDDRVYNITEDEGERPV